MYALTERVRLTHTFILSYSLVVSIYCKFSFNLSSLFKRKRLLDNLVGVMVPFGVYMFRKIFSDGELSFTYLFVRMKGPENDLSIFF